MQFNSVRFIYWFEGFVQFYTLIADYLLTLEMTGVFSSDFRILETVRLAWSCGCLSYGVEIN